jgi:hypothetical protein
LVDAAPQAKRLNPRARAREREICAVIIEEHIDHLQHSLPAGDIEAAAYSVQRIATLLGEMKSLEGWDWSIRADQHWFRGRRIGEADAALLELGKALAAAQSDQAEGDDAYERTKAIVAQIEALPAHTLAGLMVKARAVEWCNDSVSTEGLAHDPTTDQRIAAGIVCDLLRLAAARQEA